MVVEKKRHGVPPPSSSLFYIPDPGRICIPGLSPWWMREQMAPPARGPDTRKLRPEPPSVPRPLPPALTTVMLDESAPKRRRLQRSPTPEVPAEDEDYVPYVPVAQRKQAKLAKLTTWSGNRDASRSKRALAEALEREEAENEEEERRKEKARIERTLLLEAQEVHLRKAAEGACGASRH